MEPPTTAPQDDDWSKAPFLVRHAYFLGGFGTSVVAELAFDVPWWQAALIVAPVFVAGLVVADNARAEP